MSHWPELTALNVLVHVADHGSLSAAARQLHMAQPNVSRSLSRLEQRLGFALVRRTTKGTTLTAEGLVVVEWARDVLHAADTFVRNTQFLGAGGNIGLTIAASQTIAEHLLPHWMAQFRTDQPGVQVNIQVTNTEDVLASLRIGECDVGFVEGPVPTGSVNFVPVGNDKLVLVAAPSHPWATRDRVEADEVAHGNLVTREPGSGTRRVLDDALGIAVVPHLELASNAAVRVAVMSGAGPAVISRLAVHDAIASGMLIEIPVVGLDLRRTLRAVWVGPKRLRGPAGQLVRIASLLRVRSTP